MTCIMSYIKTSLIFKHLPKELYLFKNKGKTCNQPSKINVKLQPIVSLNTMRCSE